MFWALGGRVRGLVEWWDGDKLYERLTFDQLARLGVAVVVRGDMVEVQGRIVTAWPMRREDREPSASYTKTAADVPVVAVSK